MRTARANSYLFRSSYLAFVTSLFFHGTILVLVSLFFVKTKKIENDNLSGGGDVLKAIPITRSYYQIRTLDKVVLKNTKTEADGMRKRGSHYIASQRVHDGNPDAASAENLNIDNGINGEVSFGNGTSGEDFRPWTEFGLKKNVYNDLVLYLKKELLKVIQVNEKINFEIIIEKKEINDDLSVSILTQKITTIDKKKIEKILRRSNEWLLLSNIKNGAKIIVPVSIDIYN